MIENYKYKLRYAVIPAQEIFNICGPEHAGPYKWDQQSLKLRKKYAQSYMEKKKDFYANLEKSILEQGIRNPILVTAGYIQPRKAKMLPPHLRNDPCKILFCHSNGGSRLYFAKKYNLDIPCIVSDFIGRFDDCPQICNEQDLMSYYTDIPQGIRYYEYGITIKRIIGRQV